MTQERTDTKETTSNDEGILKILYSLNSERVMSRNCHLINDKGKEYSWHNTKSEGISFEDYPYIKKGLISNLFDNSNYTDERALEETPALLNKVGITVNSSVDNNNKKACRQYISNTEKNRYDTSLEGWKTIKSTKDYIGNLLTNNSILEKKYNDLKKENQELKEDICDIAEERDAAHHIARIQSKIIDTVHPKYSQNFFETSITNGYINSKSKAFSPKEKEKYLKILGFDSDYKSRTYTNMIAWSLLKEKIDDKKDLSSLLSMAFAIFGKDNFINGVALFEELNNYFITKDV